MLMSVVSEVQGRHFGWKDENVWALFVTQYMKCKKIKDVFEYFNGDVTWHCELVNNAHTRIHMTEYCN